MSGNILFLGKKIFEIPPFFQTRPGDLGKQVHACSLRFSALKMGSGTREETREAFVFSLFPSFPARFLFSDYCYFYWDTQRGAFAEERAMKP